MSGIDYFAAIVLTVIVISVVVVVIALASLPGRTARARNHPQADAINVAGWLGMFLTLGVVWVVALVWANMKTDGGNQDSDGADVSALERRIIKLEARLAASEGAGR